MSRAEELTLVADPTRFRILQAAHASDSSRVTVTELARDFGLTQPTISHHMRALLDAGLLTRAKEGRRAWYSIAPEAWERVSSILADDQGNAEWVQWARIADQLVVRFAGTFSRETVERWLAESRELLVDRGVGESRLGSHAAEFAAQRLEDEARGSSQQSSVPVVLFVCVQNAGRSQLAAAILRQLAGDRVIVRTAGSAPAGAVRPTVVAALDEIGVSVGAEFPKPLTDDAVRAADVVVTMGCGDACPVYPGRRYLDWDLEDPAGKPLDVVRGVRDDIAVRVEALLGELVH